MMSGIRIADIDDAFAAEGLQRTGEARPESLQRRGRFEEWVTGVDQSKPAESAKLAEALASFLPGFPDNVRAEILRSLERDGFEVSAGGRIVSKTPQGFTLGTVREFDAIAERAAELRAEAAMHPDDAAGHARELVESTCKTILEDRGVRIPKGMKDLLSATLETLQLVPTEAHEAKKGAAAIKSTLLALDTVVLGVSDLRLLYGGHGRSIRTGGLAPRHAALAVGAALTIVEFLIATHAEKR